MIRQGMKTFIGIKYCGGCNPHIDRTQLIEKIKKRLSPEYFFITEPIASCDIGIMICGCPTACANKPECRTFARKWILVAGSSVDLNNMPEEKLADVIADQLKKFHE